ncbi:MAG: hypothetical protein AB8G99_15840 [Planctomycetaceae bacterium]
MKRSLCERVAEPLLNLHGKTTPPAATVLLGAIGLCVAGYGLSAGNRDIAWAGVLIFVVGWYGFLLCGCYRLARSTAKRVGDEGT